MEKTLNTLHDFVLCDGSVVQLTLTFRDLLQLKSKHEEAYKAYNKIMVAGVKDEMEMVQILYTAYLCANLEKDSVLSYDDFLDGCGAKHTYVKVMVAKLINPKN